MSEGAVSSDRVQQARDNIASRRQSGLEPRPEDLSDAQLPTKPERKSAGEEPGEQEEEER